MLLSEMVGEKRYVPFKVRGIIFTKFRINTYTNGVEYIEMQDEGEPNNGFWKFCERAVLYEVIHGAPDNIIHLPPPLTDDQREQLKALWTLGYRWLAKDKYGSVYAYEAKPYEKSRDAWLCLGDLYLCYTKPTKYLEPLVSWSDPEPFDIGKALGVEE